MGFVKFGSEGPGEEETVLTWLANPSCLSIAAFQHGMNFHRGVKRGLFSVNYHVNRICPHRIESLGNQQGFRRSLLLAFANIWSQRLFKNPKVLA